MATWHVLPLDDLVEHEPLESCVCVPVIEPVPRDDGSFGWLALHSSLDCREAREVTA